MLIERLPPVRTNRQRVIDRFAHIIILRSNKEIAILHKKS